VAIFFSQKHSFVRNLASCFRIIYLFIYSFLVFWRNFSPQKKTLGSPICTWTLVFYNLSMVLLNWFFSGFKEKSQQSQSGYTIKKLQFFISIERKIAYITQKKKKKL